MDPLLTSIPINSLIIIPDNNRLHYINTIFTLPKKVQDILFSIDTGSFVRGIARTYDISAELQPTIAFIILELSIGNKTFEQLPENLSTELQLPSDKAQKMAGEIEHDIFEPVRAELDEFLAGQKGKSSPIANEATAAIATAPSTSPSYEGEKPRTAPPTRTSSHPQNVLDLKELKGAKKQELLPAKPKQPLLMKKFTTPRAHASTLLSVNPSPLQAAPPSTPLRPEATRGAAGEGTAPAPKFPLPARTNRPTPPAPPTKPLRLA